MGYVRGSRNGAKGLDDQPYVTGDGKSADGLNVAVTDQTSTTGDGTSRYGEGAPVLRRALNVTWARFNMATPMSCEDWDQHPDDLNRNGGLTGSAGPQRPGTTTYENQYDAKKKLARPALHYPRCERST